MIGLLCFVLAVLASPFKSKLRFGAENAVLRHQLIVLKRRAHGRVWFTNHDRWFLIQPHRWFPSILEVSQSSGPRRSCVGGPAFAATGVGNRAHRGGTELRALIRRMSVENPLRGAPRIHGEQLKLGFEVAQSSVAEYMVKRRGHPARDGELSCATTRRTLPPWTCSLFQLSVSTALCLRRDLV
jgi:hypothetical protein